ncbi:MAG: GNAT family N-acetyltransferase [Deltaproteobacteria bacterium]|nr:GNAT family N-acetyltransferase [Deltaproteobacteria bacterium]
MKLRPIEVSDVPALQALCGQVAGELEFEPAQVESQLQLAPGVNKAVGMFDGEALLAAAGMTALDRPRLRHAGKLWVAATAANSAQVRPLLEALRDVAFDWWHLDRLELALPATSPHHASLQGLMERELSRKRDWFDGKSIVDSFQYALLRTGLTAANVAREHVRPPKGPLPASLELREVRVEDAAGYVAVLSDPGVLWATLQAPLTPASIWIKRIASNDPARNHSRAALVDGEVVATFGLHGSPSPRRQHVWMLGMGIATAWQGRGLGRALMDDLMRIAQEQGIARVELDVYADNTRAIALYEKCGFVHEGRKRLESWREGAYTDGLAMARLF